VASRKKQIGGHTEMRRDNQPAVIPAEVENQHRSPLRTFTASGFNLVPHSQPTTRPRHFAAPNKINGIPQMGPMASSHPKCAARRQHKFPARHLSDIFNNAFYRIIIDTFQRVV
jgi:hypothetical protein